MKNEILLRKLIKEILLNEDVGSDVGVPSDLGQDIAPKLDSHGNISHSYSSHSSFSGAGGYSGGGGIFSGPIMHAAGEIGRNIKDLGSTALRAGTQFLAVSTLMSNPFSAALLGDTYIKNYLETVQKGNINKIALENLKFALMKKYSVPEYKLAVEMSGIPALIGVGSYAIQTLKRLNKNPIFDKLGTEFSKIKDELSSSTPKEIKELFNTQDSTKDFVYDILNKAKKGEIQSPNLTSGINNAALLSNELFRKNPEFRNKDKFLKHLIDNGIDKRQAKDIVNLIHFINEN